MTGQKKIKLFKWELGVNSLWLWWYCIFVLMAEGFLLYRAVNRCKEYNELPWKAEDKPVTELYVYIVLIVLSVMCLPFLVVTSVFKVGNLANDGTRLGKDLDLSSVLSKREDDEDLGPRRGGGLFRNIWKHIGPLSSGFHIVAAFVLLLPDTLLEAQEVKYGFITPDIIGQSDLDILFGRNILHKDSIIYSIEYKNGTRSTVAPPVFREEKVHGVSPEFGNYVLALIIYSLRYAAVFWHTKMSFSFVFSGMLIVAALNYTISICGTGILYKFQVNRDAFQNLDFLLPSSATIVLSLLAYGVIFFSFISVFRYGYQHYTESWLNFLKRYFPHRARPEDRVIICQGYLPHIIAALTLLCFLAFRTPVVIDMVSLYKKTNSAIILTCVLLDVGYMIVWVVTWFCFTLKQSWTFRIHPCAQCFRSTATLGGARPRSKHPRPQSAPDVMDGFVAPYTTDSNISVVMDEQNHFSPASALRKSGERRNGNLQQRVTFDDTVMDETPPSRVRRSKKMTNPEEDRPAGGGQTLYSRSTTRPLSDSLLEEKAAARVSAELQGQTTPESTLTRTYRHSLRDKCGQYYKPRDLSPPPAAQSSPVLARKQQQAEPHTDRGSNDGEIMLDAATLGQPGYPPQPPQKPPRKNIPGRPPSGPRKRDTPHSRDSSVQDDSFSTVSDTPPPRPIKQPRPRSQPVIHDSFELSSVSSSRTESPRPPLDGAPLQHHRPPLSREINRPIIITKPDLHRRDSALPSSNDTSSNESDVLCSQV